MKQCAALKTSAYCPTQIACDYSLKRFVSHCSMHWAIVMTSVTWRVCVCATAMQCSSMLLSTFACWCWSLQLRTALRTRQCTQQAALRCEANSRASSLM